MPIAALIALAERYGPTLFGLAVKYGPVLVSLLRQYGPTLEAQVGPLIAGSSRAGTLEQDVGKLIFAVQNLAPLLGEVSSLGDVADAIGSIQPSAAAAETPAMERASGSKAR